MVPQTFDIENGMFAVIQFKGSHLKYRFDLNRIDANYYVGLLAAAQKTSTTIKVYVTKQTEIVSMEK
ncbi:hypothetical protein [Pedobacter yulinensis]|nr:hypothetical protein [Pedobacter yulinensis]